MKIPQEQPKPMTAWCITWAAILDLIAFGFLIASDADLTALAIFGASEAMLIFLAVRAWKIYFEGYTKCEIKKATQGYQDDAANHGGG